MAAGLLDVKEKLRCRAGSNAREESQDARTGVLCVGRKAIRAPVRGTEGRMPLGDDIDLPGKPYTVCRKMGKQSCRGFLIGLLIGFPRTLRGWVSEGRSGHLVRSCN